MRLALAGAVLATVAGVTFVVLVAAIVLGLSDNPYAGLVVGIALPALLVLGLQPDVSDEWPVLDFRQARVRRTTLMITALTVVNIVIVLLGTHGSLRWMDRPDSAAGCATRRCSRNSSRGANPRTIGATCFPTRK